jgi:hypothetical protein
MKLYTEEQVKKMIYDGNNMWYGYDAIISRYTPIELPSDEDIEKQTKGFMFEKNKEVFYNGAKWMKEQILNQNK